MAKQRRRTPRKTARKVKRKTKARRAGGAPRARAARPVSPRAIEAALAGIAHELRTPLTGIVALAELLASSSLGVREREWAKAIKSGADHLAALTTLIIDAAKAESAGISLRNEPFSPRALAQAVGAALAARAGNKDIKAEIAIADNLPAMVSGDALRLRAALENLMDNAVKFTGEGTVAFRVDIAPEKLAGRVPLVFTISDTGIGMSKRDLGKLFRPFTQASEDINRRYGGAGLGLVFVKRIAEAMGGKLGLQTKPGRGTTFRLEVPVDVVDAQPAAEPGARSGPRRPLTILCAEDNPYGRVVMNTILTELGHRVDFVDSGEAAVRAAERGGYDALLVDVVLAGLDGLAATRAIRALPGKAGQVPVIGISGRNEADAEAAARAAGMNYFFAKPVSPGKLAQALAAIG